jgi:hypothetical protein
VREALVGRTKKIIEGSLGVMSQVIRSFRRTLKGKKLAMTAKFYAASAIERGYAHGIGKAWDISLVARNSESERVAIRVIDALDSAGRL